MKRKKIIYVICITLILGYIIWNSPLTVDDLYYKAFGLNGLKEVFNFAISYGNGRLLGNMLIHFIIKFSVIRVLFQTTVIMLLCMIICRFTEIHKNDVFYLGITLYFSVSPFIFRDTYLWSSAFANYIPGIICMFAAWYIVKNKENFLGHFVLLIISILGQLFVEHTSIINIVFAIFILIAVIKNHSSKSQVMNSVIWVIGTIVGAIVMFMIPKLFYIENEWKNYQKSIDISNVKSFIVGILANGMQISGVYLQNTMALITLSIVLIILIKPQLIEKAILIIVPLYGFVVNFIVGNFIGGTGIIFVNLLLFLVYCSCVVMLLIKNDSIKGKKKILFYMFMCAFSVCPLLVVYPIGARCFLHSYVFLIMMILTMINENIDKFNLNIIKVFSVSCMCILSIFLIFRFYNVGRIDKERLKYTREEVNKGKNIIYVPKIESMYVKDNDGWSYGQVFYHNKKQDIRFIFIDYNKWRLMIRKH